MKKKLLGVIAAFVFVLGAIPQTNIAKNLVSACSHFCCYHSGDVWDN